MFEFARHNPGDDLHILVRVSVETGPGRHDVVIADQQQPVMRVRRIVVARKAEAVARLEPPSIGGETAVGATDVDGWLGGVCHLVS